MEFPAVKPVDPRVFVADHGVLQKGELDNVGDLLHVVKGPGLRWECLLPNGFSGDEVFRTVADGLKTFHGRVPRYEVVGPFGTDFCPRGRFHEQFALRRFREDSE